MAPSGLSKHQFLARRYHKPKQFSKGKASTSSRMALRLGYVCSIVQDIDDVAGRCVFSEKIILSQSPTSFQTRKARKDASFNFELHSFSSSLKTKQLKHQVHPTMASAPGFPSRPFTTGVNRSTAGGSSAPPAQTPQPFNTTITPIYGPQHPSTQQRGQLERGDRLSAQALPAQNALADLSEEQREEINEVQCPK
jgi:hypothetical protein